MIVLRAFALTVFVSLLMHAASAEPPSDPLDEETQGDFAALLGIVLQGTGSINGVNVSLGASISTLVCSCLEDGSCSDTLRAICDPINELFPGADASFFSPLAEGTSDPTNALCAIGGYAGIPVIPSAPAGISPWERPDLLPPEPTLSIEAVRYPDGERYAYALRYDALISDEDFDDYDGIEYEVKRAGDRDSIFGFTGTDKPDGASGLPLSTWFSRAAPIYTHACISFDDVPQGLPAELCVPFREVESS